MVRFCRVLQTVREGAGFIFIPEYNGQPLNRQTIMSHLSTHYFMFEKKGKQSEARHEASLKKLGTDRASSPKTWFSYISLLHFTLNLFSS